MVLKQLNLIEEEKEYFIEEFTNGEFMACTNVFDTSEEVEKILEEEIEWFRKIEE